MNHNSLVHRYALLKKANLEACRHITAIDMVLNTNISRPYLDALTELRTQILRRLNDAPIPLVMSRNRALSNRVKFDGN